MNRPLRFAIRLCVNLQVLAWLGVLAARGLTPEIGFFTGDVFDAWRDWSAGSA